KSLQEFRRRFPRLAHRRIPRTREEAAGLTSATELGTSPEGHEHAFEGRESSSAATLQSDDSRLADVDEDGQFALAHPPVATQSGQPLAERGAGREVTTDQLKMG